MMVITDHYHGSVKQTVSSQGQHTSRVADTRNMAEFCFVHGYHLPCCVFIEVVVYWRGSYVFHEQCTICGIVDVDCREYHLFVFQAEPW